MSATSQEKYRFAMLLPLSKFQMDVCSVGMLFEVALLDEET